MSRRWRMVRRFLEAKWSMIWKSSRSRARRLSLTDMTAVWTTCRARSILGICFKETKKGWSFVTTQGYCQTMTVSSLTNMYTPFEKMKMQRQRKAHKKRPKSFLRVLSFFKILAKRDLILM